MNRIVDIYLVYEFIKRLSTPFDKTPAFARGIINAQGEVLRPRKTLVSSEDKNAWTWFDILINNLKRLIKDLPGGQNQMAIIASSLFLLREPKTKLRLFARMDEATLRENFILTPQLMAEAKQIEEDAPVNAAGNGGVAGLGVGPQGEPGFKNKKFAGRKVFSVSPTIFERCRLGKRSHAHYRTYVGEDAVGQEIRQYGRANRNEAIILQNEQTQAMLYLRYPKS